MSEKLDSETRCRPLPLGSLEQHVMDALWDSEPLTIREVIVQLGAQHAYTTIATVLGNLDRKKLIVSSREGRAVKYTARCTREQHTARLMEVALDTSRDRAAAILHFVDSIDSHDLNLLREYLEQQKDRP